MKINSTALGLLTATTSYLATTGTADAGVMSIVMSPEARPGTIIVFVVGVVVGALLVYFLRRGR